MSEWKEVQLNDVVSIIGDGLHGTPKFDDKGDYYFINGNNLSNGKIIIKSDTRKTTLEEYEKYRKKIDDRTIKDIQIIIPPTDFQKDNTPVLAEIYQKKEANRSQIRTLEKLRDTLLPKLMSGEVRVEI